MKKNLRYWIEQCKQVNPEVGAKWEANAVNPDLYPKREYKFMCNALDQGEGSGNFYWYKSPEKSEYWDGICKSMEEHSHLWQPKEEGVISKSMGINTKPAHRFEVDGYWVMVDPQAPIDWVEELKKKLNAKQ